jgi:hypothetical protein
VTRRLGTKVVIVMTSSRSRHNRRVTRRAVSPTEPQRDPGWSRT